MAGRRERAAGPPRGLPVAACLRAFLASLPFGSAAFLPFADFSFVASGRSTSSKIAMGAPSPRRVPTGMMRV